jgi:cytochrome c oxidase subunit 2
LRWADRIAITLIVTGIALGAAAFAVFSFYDPVQAAFFSHAQTVVGIPVEWQFNFQHPFSDNEQDLYRFHNFLLGLSVAICALVTSLVAVAIWRFRQSRHPVAARTTHNTPLEVIWTLVPAFVLIIMATWSFALLNKLDNPPSADLTAKVTGNQWFWSYAYPDDGNIQFSSVILPDEKLAPEQRSLRLLAVDQPLVLPIRKIIRFQITSADVVHSWGVQSLGVKKDAIPGRLNETWTRIDREGVYYGDCYELCGRNHAFMPVAIEAVSPERFDAWLADARRRLALGQAPAPRASLALTDGTAPETPR